MGISRDGAGNSRDGVGISRQGVGISRYGALTINHSYLYCKFNHMSDNYTSNNLSNDYKFSRPPYRNPFDVDMGLVSLGRGLPKRASRHCSNRGCPCDSNR